MVLHCTKPVQSRTYLMGPMDPGPPKVPLLGHLGFTRAHHIALGLLAGHTNGPLDSLAGLPSRKDKESQWVETSQPGARASTARSSQSKSEVTRLSPCGSTALTAFAHLHAAYIRLARFNLLRSCITRSLQKDRKSRARLRHIVRYILIAALPWKDSWPAIGRGE